MIINKRFRFAFIAKDDRYGEGRVCRLNCIDIKLTKKEKKINFTQYRSKIRLTYQLQLICMNLFVTLYSRQKVNPSLNSQCVLLQSKIYVVGVKRSTSKYL